VISTSRSGPEGLNRHVGEPEVTDRLVRLGGGQVLSAACVSGDATPQPCGRPVKSGWLKSGWRVDLEGSAAVGVFAQVDLPTA